jgi:DNA-binding MarR family transcriptional regulator
MDPLRRQQTDAKVLRVLTALEKLRELNREFPAQLLSTLLYVASHKDCHKQAMEEDLDLTTASGSRNTDLLSHSHRLGREGLGLIIKEPDPSNGRRLQLRLTLEGQCLIDTLKEILYD